ncbi:NAD-dependent epimerase/dehydratase family protein [Limnoglobus roseus]|uniref:3-beta hydroxysteroid dehydrogenase n=1 Tax=Limnoglobus roseus TaxID=2598579 RepID=A0A5C1ABG0_9BACT|nr:NAD-dependent epimerase/dehydratase family protein [Limnoglobus roseus]QEL15142.1 3-beta hydroxysteroid dehydrogenase [Limnoglobus roseus]
MKALVTGGGGFLGGAIVRALRARGDTPISFTRSRYAWLDEIGVQQRLGDLTDLDAVDQAVAGCDVVIHVAAKAGVWGRYADYVATNITGTENVLAACRTQGVRKLVYTSTPSVVHTGVDIAGENESLPYAKHFDSYYPQTKAKAEQAVLAANGSDLATVALRPHLIWGPGDPHLIPRLLARARLGKLKRIGTREVKIDLTYVDNAADAHVLAADKLEIGSPIAGKAYFISNGDPVVMWTFLNRILADAGVPPVTKTVPGWVARLTGRALEAVYGLFRVAGEPSLTLFVAKQLSTSHWYDISAAKNDLGYDPQVSIEEGLKRLAASFKPHPG